MIKKTILFCLALASCVGLMAQSNNQMHRTDKAGRGIYNRIQRNAKDITFNTSDIQFWCGNGTNQGTVIVAWDDMDTPVALVWGVRWNGNAVASDLLDSIVAYDSRFSYTPGSFIGDVEYTENGETYSSDINYWCFYLNGAWAMNTYETQDVVNGDVIEMSGSCMFDMTTAVAATNPNASSDPDTNTTPTVRDTTFAASDILFWVGQGANEAVLSFTWAEPDVALAWGVRFADDTITLQAAMDSIACHDYRLSYIPGSWGIDDIIYNDYLGTTYALSHADGIYNYWWSNINGHACLFGYDAQPVVNGDFLKWGDVANAIVVDTAWGYPSEYAWLVPITPASVLVSGPFCGAADTEGSQAIAYNDNRIKGWATACELVLGPENITVQDSPAVSYGDADQALGECTDNNLNVVSLGDGGMATLTFAHAISNGEGPDFAIFENSFNDNFLELAFVEVSTDGQRFVRFPATSLTSSCHGVGGIGGIDPTYINNLAGKYRTGFGTGFDLEDLRDSTGINIDSIVYVRVIDVVGTIDPDYATYDQYGHIVVDPFPTDSYSSGFDLDGVCVLNWNYQEPETPESITIADDQLISLYPNPAADQVTITVADGLHTLVLYDVTGRELQHSTFSGSQLTVNLQHISNGIYILRVDGNAQRLAIKH